MKLWTKCLITLFVLVLASSSLMAADLHWLFFDNVRAEMKEAAAASRAEATLEQAQAALQMPSSEQEQTKQPEPLQSLSEESLESDAETGYAGFSEDAVIAAVEDAIRQMEYAYEVKDEAFVIVSAQYEAQGIDYNALKNDYSALKEDYRNLQDAYSKSMDPFDLFILPEVGYTLGENVWSGSLNLGFIYNNFMFSMGVAKSNIDSFDSFKNPYGYTMKMGVGIIF